MLAALTEFIIGTIVEIIKVIKRPSKSPRRQKIIAIVAFMILFFIAVGIGICAK